MKKEPKYCEDCKHISFRQMLSRNEDWCVVMTDRACAKAVSLIKIGMVGNCEIARLPGQPCGPTGKLWEKRG